jgi:hypothetical protein
MFYEYHRLGEAARGAARVVETDAVGLFVDCIPPLPINCPGGTGCDQLTGKAVESIKALVPEFAPGNLKVVYDRSLVDVDAATVTPTVTVNLVDLKYKFLLANVFFGLETSFTFPPFSTTRVAATYKAC